MYLWGSSFYLPVYVLIALHNLGGEGAFSPLESTMLFHLVQQRDKGAGVHTTMLAAPAWGASAVAGGNVLGHLLHEGLLDKCPIRMLWLIPFLINYRSHSFVA